MSNPEVYSMSYSDDSQVGYSIFVRRAGSQDVGTVLSEYRVLKEQAPTQEEMDTACAAAVSAFQTGIEDGSVSLSE